MKYCHDCLNTGWVRMLATGSDLYPDTFGIKKLLDGQRNVAVRCPHCKENLIWHNDQDDKNRPGERDRK